MSDKNPKYYFTSIHLHTMPLSQKHALNLLIIMWTEI